MFKIFLNGSTGRMGQAISAAVASDPDLVIEASGDLEHHGFEGLSACDVAIDFSNHAATLPLAQQCAAHHLPLVIGTTGHLNSERHLLEALGSRIPIVWAGNYSIGVNLLLYLVENAARILPSSYQIELFEAHHQHKVDAPSGTAENLLSTILAARNLDHSQLRHGRHGITGARTSEEIGVHSLRAADIVGEHTVWFAGSGERLELTHRATDRSIFALGALQAAKWLLEATPSPGIYSMREVLGLTSSTPEQ
ncbi:MAG: 4-hydroxy-tetrahydrodipicolinate reductase [Puniceicoccaceae bacterium]